MARIIYSNRWADRWDNRRTANVVYDGATFSISLLLLLGVYEPETLKLIGNTTPILGVAGVLGVIHSYNALFPDKRD